MQGRRGRVAGGYDTFERDHQLSQHGHHRSLSPSGGIRGGRGQRIHAPGAPTRRASSEETNPLLHPSRSRGGSNRDGGRITEEGYPSPGDARFASPGRGSPGDSTRRLFYKVILLALLSRFILLPVETYCLSAPDNNPMLLQILLRISQTLPDLAFASALGLLVTFCAKVAFAAMPPPSPELSDGSTNGDEATDNIEDGTNEGDGLLVGDGGTKEGDIDGDSASGLKRKSRMARKLCTSVSTLSQTILASKKTFPVWNGILLTSYTLVFVAASAIPHVPVSVCEIALWTFMATVYAILTISLVYVAVLLWRALHPGIVRRKKSDSLAVRLVWTCILLAIMFIDGVASFSMAANEAIANLDGNDHEEIIRTGYLKSTIEYTLLESLPVLFILVMMHRRRKEIQNDVLIIHSIMNNLFGSTGRLVSSESGQADTSRMPPSSTGDGAAARGGLGSRRFQSYGGVRVDSFPPASAGARDKVRRNMPRAVSSSGGAGRLKQQPNVTDALAQEGTAIAGGAKKGGMKSFVPARTGRE